MASVELSQPDRTGGGPVYELERQVERGSMFTQAVFQKSFTRLSLVEAVIRELADVLVERGLLAEEDLSDARGAMDGPAGHARDDQEVATSIPWPAVAIRVDNPAEAGPEPVDCAARMHVCQAVCCRLKFALSQDEVERGRVKWDIGHPYVIRQDSSGYCCHNDATTRGCSVYQDRPVLCRRYSCRGDARIWSDFEAMELNTQWIDEHLAEGDAILLVDADADADAGPPRPGPQTAPALAVAATEA